MKVFPRRISPSIRVALFLLLAVIFIPHLVAEAIHYRTMFDERINQAYQSNLETARSVAVTFEAYVQNIVNQELAMGSAFASSPALSKDEIGRLLAISAKETPSIRHYLWLGPGGRVIATSPPDAGNLDLSERPYFQSISQGRDWVVSDLFQGQGEIRGQFIFVVARGIRDESGSLQGVVVADVDPSRLSEVLKLERSSNNAISVIDGKGRCVYRHPEGVLTWEQRDWLPSQPALSQALAGSEARGTRETVTNLQPRMVGYTPIRSVDWVVSASSTGNETIALIENELFREARVELIDSAAAILLALVIAGYIEIPLRRLRRSAVLLGRGQPVEEIEVGGPAEIRDLAGSLRSMADEVQAREEQLRKANSELAEVNGLVREQAQTLSMVNEELRVENAERKAAEAALTESRDFYLTLLEGFPNPIWRSGQDGCVDYFNHSWLAFTGKSLEVETGEGWMLGLHPDDLDRFAYTYLGAFKDRRPFEVEFRLRHHQGEYRWLVAIGRPFYDLDGAFAGYISSCYDITERKEHEERLSYLALHDSLTGLPNRRVLEEALERAVSRARRGVESVLLFMDLDDFKEINDTLGHAAGDRALIELASVLKTQLREEDIVSRLGGDEFAVLMEGTNLDQAEVVSERMRSAVEGFGFSMNNHHFALSLSVGIAVVDGTLGALSVLARADVAMYKAKEDGGNRSVVGLT